ncbi:MAG: redoxin family protein [Thiobacillus sp.]|nr:redoxin family protein [Thiobacillus sp.]
MPTLKQPLLAATALAVLAGLAQAATVTDVDAVPQLDARGKDGYRQFLAIASPRAFAIAPGGAWGYSTEAGTAAMAEQEALANCQANTRQRCQVYARDDSVVLSQVNWIRSWGPYKNASAAAKAKAGTLPGDRFPDLLLKDVRGKPVKLSSLRGKIVVLHFWGSWCPPCQREMPDLAKLAETSKRARDIRFLFVQVREDFAKASEWARKVAPGLPLFDSGMTGGSDTDLHLADGGRIADRSIAMAFPTTYVIDKHGIVVFAHVGPVSGWDQYIPFLRDAAARSGK